MVHMLCCVQLIEFTVCCSWCHQFIELFCCLRFTLYCVQFIEFTVCSSWCHQFIQFCCLQFTLYCVQLIQFTVCCSWCQEFTELLLLTVHTLLCTAHTVYSLLFMVSPSVFSSSALPGWLVGGRGALWCGAAGLLSSKPSPFLHRCHVSTAHRTWLLALGMARIRSLQGQGNNEDRETRIGKQRQGNKDRETRTGKQGQENKDRETRTGKQGQGNKDRGTRTGER